MTVLTSNSITIEFCGRLAELAPPSIEMHLPEQGQTIAQLRGQLAREYPALADEMDSPKVQACVDEVMAQDSATISPGQTVAFFPPLSGG